MVVRCGCCHREERHGPQGVTVLQPGGLRRPSEPRVRAVFELLAALDPKERVVDDCPACGMPRTSPDAPGVPVELPELGLKFRDGAFEQHGQRLLPHEARRVRDAAVPAPVESRGLVAVQTVMVLAMAGPVVLWLFLAGFWFNYVYNLGAAPWRG